MTDTAARILCRPFEEGLIEAVGEKARVLVLNAPADRLIPNTIKSDLSMQQDLRPVAVRLERMGLKASPAATGEGYDLALVLADRHRGANEIRLAEALERVAPGSVVVVAGEKTNGISSLRKRAAALHGIEGHAAKHHGEAFWMKRSEGSNAFCEAVRAANGPAELSGGYVAFPGLFSHDRIDRGSALLASHLPADLGGRAADFGAGWGYLSVELARRAKAVARIDLFEASRMACDAASANLRKLAPSVEFATHWHDLVSEPVAREYDVVVMNPPFHAGRAADPAIGQAFVRTASAALKPGGRLFLVANQGLPYEPMLAEGFRRTGELVRADGYKILWAVR